MTYQPVSHFPKPSSLLSLPGDPFNQSYLERQLHLHFIRQHLRDNTIESRENLHRELWLDPAFVDQIIERIGKGQADTATETPIELVTRSHTPKRYLSTRTHKRRNGEEVPAPTVELVVSLRTHGDRQTRRSQGRGWKRDWTARRSFSEMPDDT